MALALFYSRSDPYNSLLPSPWSMCEGIIEGPAFSISRSLFLSCVAQDPLHKQDATQDRKRGVQGRFSVVETERK